MTRGEAKDAVLGLLKAEWDGLTPPIPEIRWPDQDEGAFPPSTASWARVACYDVEGSQHSLGVTGGRRFVRAGLVVIEIHTPRGDGEATMETLLGAVRAALEGKSVGALETRDFTELPPVSEGPWRRAAVTVGFVYDEVK